MFYYCLMALIPALDLALKSGIEAAPDESYPREVRGTGGKVQFRKLHNPGFPMGALKEKPELVRCLPLAVTSALLLKLSSMLPWRGKKLQKLGLSLCVGGSASNLFDRFFRRYVVDYLFVDVKPLNRLVFNLGDVSIASGAMLSAVGAFLPGKKAAGARIKGAAAGEK